MLISTGVCFCLLLLWTVSLQCSEEEEEDDEEMNADGCEDFNELK